MPSGSKCRADLNRAWFFSFLLAGRYRRLGDVIPRVSGLGSAAHRATRIPKGAIFRAFLGDRRDEPRALRTVSFCRNRPKSLPRGTGMRRAVASDACGVNANALEALDPASVRPVYHKTPFLQSESGPYYTWGEPLEATGNPPHAGLQWKRCGGLLSPPARSAPT